MGIVPDTTPCRNTLVLFRFLEIILECSPER